jgi:LPXTG-motif cell wall-anchored protein
MFAGTEMVVYDVVEGDTLNEIAAHFGTTADQIAMDNQLDDPDVIEVGQQLMINANDNVTVPVPVKAIATPTPTKGVAQKSSNIGAYIFASLLVGVGVWFFFKRKKSSKKGK